MRAPLRAGIAIYNAGEHHAAHDAWEDRWLDLEAGTDDERLLHGLIQFTAAIYHARRHNWEGATGLADSGRGYLSAVPPDYRAVNVDAVRSYLATLAADPAVIERTLPPALTHEGAVLALEDLDPAAVVEAATVLAEEHGYDEEPFERAATYARDDPEDGRDTFLALLRDFACSPADRPVIADRLAAHVERRRQRREDVEGLFD